MKAKLIKFKIWVLIKLGLRPSKVWFTSDWHFGHKNVIQYCNRPFTSVEHMNAELINKWNSTIGPNDTVYFLGDFSINDRWLKLVSPHLNGKKILVIGNHEKAFSHRLKNLAKSKEKMKEYLNYGWDEVHITMEFELKDGTKVLLSHLPYSHEEVRCFDDRYWEHRPVDEGQFLLHGHHHVKYVKYMNMIDVGIDNREMKIYSEDEIIALVNDKRILVF